MLFDFVSFHTDLSTPKPFTNINQDSRITRIVSKIHDPRRVLGKEFGDRKLSAISKNKMDRLACFFTDYHSSVGYLKPREIPDFKNNSLFYFASFYQHFKHLKY